MRLNELSPGVGAKQKKVRLGRGIGSGMGKTGGRGHKGQKARAGGNVKAGFEGGQMPLQRRLPKFGFKSRIALTSREVRTSELNGLDAAVITLDVLKSAGLVQKSVTRASIVLSGDVTRAYGVKGIRVTKGVRQAVLNAGGSVED
jgi:large subunit ribosomal protein L15